MAYEKYEWQRGEIVTSDKLNNMENRIEEVDNKIDSEVQAITSEANTLKSRVDQIIAPTGEAPNHSEITDARVGEDGVTYDSLGNAIREQVGNIKSALIEFNTINFLEAPGSMTKNGITWTPLGGARVAVSGTAESPSLYNLYFNDAALPAWAEKGKTYSYIYESKQNVYFRIMYHDGTDWTILFNSVKSSTFTIPQNARGLIVRLWVQAGTQNVNEVVEPIILSGATNKELLENFKNYLPITTTIDINANDDLNNYLVPGTYASRSNSITSTLSNIPDTLPSGAFMLTVIKTIGGTPNTRRFRQFIFSEITALTLGDSRIYTRYMPSDNSWTPWMELASADIVNETKSNISIFQTVTATLVKSINFITDEQGITYGTQGMTATDKYIVMGLDAINTVDHPDVARKYNALLILNKSDYSMADLPENPIFKTVEDYEGVETCHMANLSWDSEAKEIYIRTVSGGVNNDITIVIDDSTFEIKRYVDLKYPGAFDYDNITQRWAFNHYVLPTPPVSDILRIADKELKIARSYTFARQGTTQGMLYYNGIVFTPSSASAEHNNNIRVTDSKGNLLRVWYFPNNTGANEFEDLAAISDNKILLSTNSNNQYRLFEIIYRAYNIPPSDIKEWDKYINCNVDMGE